MDVSKELLYRFWSGQLTLTQKQHIRRWLEQPAHQEQYFRWLEEYERLEPEYEADQERLEALFEQKLLTATLPDAPVARPARFWPWMAAILALGLLLWLTAAPLRYRSYTTAPGQQAAFDLPDGSRVTLNGHSRLRVPRFGFLSGPRRVDLAGEAVFEVVHTRTHQPFSVETPAGTQVEVLGTAFSVRAGRGATQVVLQRGQVRLRHARRQLLLRPGDWAEWQADGRLQQGRQPSPQAFAPWRYRRFDFDGTPLREIAAMLAESYGVRIRIENDSLARRSVSGSFRSASADEVLTALSALLGFEVLRSETEMLLRPTHVTKP